MEKQCNTCNRVKPLTEFHKASRNAGGRYHTCKQCRVKIDRDRYETSNKKDVSMKRTKFIKDFVTFCKSWYGCKYCPETHTACLEFHHRNPEEKEFGLAPTPSSIKRAKQEIKKCDVVCSNCHRKIHYRDKSK